MYSLAGTLYHALTGHVPFEAPTVEEVVAAHLHVALRPAHEVLPGVTLPTSEALAKAMSKDPHQRFPSYDEFIMALTAARSQLLIREFAPQVALDAAMGQPGPSKSWWRR
jgi:serine/threonine-protein kinase